MNSNCLSMTFISLYLCEDYNYSGAVAGGPNAQEQPTIEQAIYEAQGSAITQSFRPCVSLVRGSSDSQQRASILEVNGGGQRGVWAG